MTDINKRLNWISALMAGILLVLPGCDSESMLDTPAPAGSTVLRIGTKGIVVDPETGTPNYEEYVKTLRLIGFQEGKQVLNHPIDNLAGYEVKGTDPDTYIEIPLNQSTDASIQRGTLDLYAVANEDAGEFVDNTFWDAIEENKLKSLMITAQGSYSAPDKDYPFLMSAETHPTLLEAENNINIELVRTVGKVELASVKVTDGTSETPLENYTYTLSASGKVLGTYPLFLGGTSGTGEKELSMTPTGSPLYLSDSADNAVTITVSVTPTNGEKSYTGTLTAKIERNKCIQINATITQVEEEKCLLLQSTITNWIGKELKPEYK